MARKVQITKEIILQTALDMLIRDGYSSINIKTLAKEIGCSTQPLVWHFNSMEGLRSALAEYARNYATSKIKQKKSSAFEAFEQIGQAYVEMALREPNLFKFLYLDENNSSKMNHFDEIVTRNNNAELIRKMAETLKIKEEGAGRFLQNTIIYSQGIATLAATGMIKTSEKEMMTMINRAADTFLMQEGVPLEQIPQTTITF